MIIETHLPPHNLRNLCLIAAMIDIVAYNKKSSTFCGLITENSVFLNELENVSGRRAFFTAKSDHLKSKAWRLPFLSAR